VDPICRLSLAKKLPRSILSLWVGADVDERAKLVPVARPLGGAAGSADQHHNENSHTGGTNHRDAE
jgi:hypothetical protein